tara:strand:+ start:2452 stop:3030 length:579 start_codon:yes stop_codon:yes gene_type:complete
MDILIVVATEFEITSEKIKKKPVLVTGVGMVNVAVNLTKELMQKKYDLVINMGIAGSFDNRLRNGDVVEVIEDCFSEIGFEDGEVFNELTDFNLQTIYKVKPKTNLEGVNAITVNTVHGNEVSIKKIITRLNPSIESMEGASVFKVCEEFNISCLQIRSVSNRVERRNKKHWDLDAAIRNLNFEVEKLINNL